MKWLIPIPIILVAGFLFFQNPEPPIGGVKEVKNPTMSVDGRDIPLTYTDDNTGEDLIIYSDAKDYYGFGSATGYFSVQNLSNKDQNVKVVFSVPKGDLISVRMKTGDSVVQDEFVQMASGTTQTVVGYTRTDWQDNSVKSLDISGYIRKSVGGLEAGKESGTYLIKSGEVKFFEVRWKYGEEGEFFVEAFGDQGSYSHLDPNNWASIDSFTGYSGALDAENGGTGWGENSWALNRSNSFTTNETTVFITSPSIKATADDTGDTRDLTSVADGILKFSLRRTSKATGSCIIQINSGTTLGWRITLNTADILLVGATTETLVSNYSTDTWYTIHLNFDTAGTGTGKARLDGDSSWDTSVGEANSITGISRVQLDAIGTMSGTCYIDDIDIGSDPSSATTAVHEQDAVFFEGE